MSEETALLFGLGLAVTIGASWMAAMRTIVSRLHHRLDQIHDTLTQMLVILDRRLPDRP